MSGGKLLVVAVKNSGYREGSYEYKNKINLYDASLILMFLQDLQNQFNAPIDKVVDLYLKSKKGVFPI